MKCNVGGADRVIRAVVGIAVIGAGVVFKSWWGLIGLVPLLTAVFGFCCLYVPLKIDTSCKTSDGGGCCCGHDHGEHK